MHNNGETISNPVCLVEDVFFGIDLAVIKRIDREVKEKICIVCFELAEYQSACFRYLIIDITFDHTERTSI